MPKRDFDRIRELLLMAEAIPADESDDFNAGYVDLMENLSSSDGYQLGLMKDAGLIEGSGASDGFFRITFAGHDFLDSVRDNSLWEKTKAAVADTGGNATLEIVKGLAVGFLRNKVEKHTGIIL